MKTATQLNIPTNSPIETMINLSVEVKKPKKAEVIQLIKELAEQYPDTIYTLAQFYSYFLPPIPRKAKTDFEWVAMATSDHKDIREYLRYLYSDGTHLYGCNGHRAHRILTDLPIGYYNHVGDKLESINYRYPDIQSIFKNAIESREPTVPFSLSIVTEVAKFMAYKHDNKIAFNKRYVDAAIQLPGYSALVCEKKLVIQYPDNSREAVVMHQAL